MRDLFLKCKIDDSLTFDEAICFKERLETLAGEYGIKVTAENSKGEEIKC